MSFMSDMQRFEKNAKQRMRRAVQRVTLEVFKDVVTASPVDTGRYRDSWRIGINDVDTSVSPERPRDYESPLHVGMPPTPEELSKAKAKVAEIFLGDEVAVSNSLEYADAIEDGWSQQAPNGIAALAIIRAENGMASVVRSLESEV